MNKTANNEATSEDPEKPVHSNDNDIKFPPFPDPTNDDFDEDVIEEEREFYKTKFKDLNFVITMKLHCTACDRHIGCSVNKENIMRVHPMLRTLVCITCHTFYNSGEFEKGDDGSELYCRWCGQGGQVYCCSNCPHVFCSRCVKRNFGVPKIKEIENTDDWKCFKCESRCLWELRSVCWALLRYCDLKNKITELTQDPQLKEAYKKDCSTDHTMCCKNKIKRREKQEAMKKKEKEAENSAKKSISPLNVISKIPPTIQVKKFASINLDDSPKEKKPLKRPISPRTNSIFIRNPIPLPSCSNIISPISLPTMPKKMRMTHPPQNFIRYKTYSRLKPKPPQMQLPILPSNQFNGFNNTDSFGLVVNDNINLSLESLTQGLDMTAVAAMSNRQNQDDDVVCTPDFPLEPLCEVTEDNTDDDVQCITPGPVAAPKLDTPPPPPLLARAGTTIPDLTTDNIIQMTENDVTVNTATGGLKFRVDPQTLSSNKMYRLPDGRIFAINANPNMPGGYSATIVAVTESSANNKATTAPKGATYSAKLSAVHTSEAIPPPLKLLRNQNIRNSTPKNNTNKVSKVTRSTETSSRECDLDVPVEWYRYNLMDAVDALEYSLSRVNKLKKETTPIYLRTRTVDEMRHLHRTLERLLNTSSRRFREIRDNLQKDLKEYLLKKSVYSNNSDDDDDVEILNDLGDNDDPIFIDENSMDSNANANESREVVMSCVTNRGITNSYNHEKLAEKGYIFTKIPIRNSNSNETHKIENRNASICSSVGANNMSDIYCKESMNNDVHENDEHEDIQTNDNQSKSNEMSVIEEDIKKEDTVLHESVVEHDDNKVSCGVVEQMNKSQEECNEDGNKIKNVHNKTNNEITQDKETHEEVGDNDKKNEDKEENEEIQDRESDGAVQDEKDKEIKDKEKEEDDKDIDVKIEDKESDDKLISQDSEISEELIESLLKEDDGMDESDNTHNINSLDVAEVM